MILIEDKTKHAENVESYKQDIARILDHLGYSDFDISVIFVDLETMQDFNKQYRNMDKPTDILSFPFYPQLKAGKKIEVKSEEDKNLGDIILCPSYIKEDLSRWDQTYEQRMKVLIVHGICHLLGYDHIQDNDYEVMKKKEEELLTLIQH